MGSEAVVGIEAGAVLGTGHDTHGILYAQFCPFIRLVFSSMFSIFLAFLDFHLLFFFLLPIVSFFPLFQFCSCVLAP